MNYNFPACAMFWDDATGKPDPNYAMYGTVNTGQYNGTTMVFNVTSSTGGGATKGKWIISTTNAGTDGQHGSRQVVRHNTFSNAVWQWHGTEASGTRGGRALEFYENEMINNRFSNGPLLFRSGTGIIYNNTLTNWGSATPGFGLVNYSSRSGQPRPWGGPDGRNPFHKNNPGNPFVKGSITSIDGTNVYRDNTKTWTLNQWQGYTIRLTSGISISSMTYGGRLSVTTATPHGFVNGDTISIYDCDQRNFNALYYGGQIDLVDATHFTVATDFPDTTPATGSMKCHKGSTFGLISSSSTNGTLTVAVSINGAPFSFHPEVLDTYEINKLDYVMDQCGMGVGSLLTIDASNLPVGFPNQIVSPLYQWNNGGSSFGSNYDYSGGTCSTIKQMFTISIKSQASTDPLASAEEQPRRGVL